MTILLFVQFHTSKLADSDLRAALYSLLGLSCFVKARSYLQFRADALLRLDKRAPVLFLRSFADDYRFQSSLNSEQAIVDHSLEVRLAKHFNRYGPFVAVGAPGDDTPVQGAARLRLKDEEWQEVVLGWMRAAKLIVMSCGATPWVNWELSKIIESKRTSDLILLFPELGERTSARDERVTARAQLLQQAFANTVWLEHLTAVDHLEDARAMLFRADGSVVTVRAKSTSREAYHFAALVAHHRVLFPTPSAGANESDAPRRQLAFAPALLLAAVCVMAALPLLEPGYGERITFKGGSLYYREDSVSRHEAERLGELLNGLGYFSDDRKSDVQLVRDGGVLDLRFVTSQEARSSSNFLLPFAALVAKLSEAFGAPLKAELCDEHLEPTVAVPPMRYASSHKGRVFYQAPVSAEEARSVARELATMEFFDDEQDREVYLSRPEIVTEIRLLVDGDLVRELPAVAESLSEISDVLREKSFAGADVLMMLIDSISLNPIVINHLPVRNRLPVLDQLRAQPW
jgi:hypothetical protein